MRHMVRNEILIECEPKGVFTPKLLADRMLVAPTGRLFCFNSCGTEFLPQERFTSRAQFRPKQDTHDTSMANQCFPVMYLQWGLSEYVTNMSWTIVSNNLRVTAFKNSNGCNKAATKGKISHRKKPTSNACQQCDIRQNIGGLY